jgi:hypothetical protein
MKNLVRTGLPLAALAAAFLPASPVIVERLYASGAYVSIQSVLTSSSNRMSFAALDVLILTACLAWVVIAFRDLTRSPTKLRGGARIIGRTITWSATLYLVFLAVWGLNYRRLRLAEKLLFEPAAVTADAARAAGARAVERLNAVHDRAHADGWPTADRVDPPLAAAFARALDEIGFPRSIVTARPKRTMLDWYFRRAGVDGMTDPFFLETLVASDVLPFELPFVIAHEWSHLAGVANEGDANFVGWLACQRGSAAAQYSGWLFLYGELARAVNARDRAAMAEALAAGPRADLRAARDRYTREVSPRVASAGWRVYDSYLKANRVEAGAASYAEVVRLVLGVRLADSPLVRP